MLQWVAISFSRGSSWPRDRTQVSCIAGRFFTVWATREDLMMGWMIQIEHWFLILTLPLLSEAFSDSSVGKESACNAGDLSSIPGSGRSAGEGLSYPFQYSWASPVAQLVKNPPAMWETWVWSLCWEDPLEKGKATHSSILVWRIPWTIESMRLQRAGHS